MSRVFKTKDNQITYPYKKGVHDGIDLVGRQGDKFDYVVAHSDGVVVSVVKNYKSNDKTGASYGNYVKIKHNNGYYTLSAHLAYGSVCVSNGQKVSKGQTIGYMGATGRADGAHVHWEVRNTSDVRIDPTPYINADLPGSKKKIDAIYRVYCRGHWYDDAKNGQTAGDNTNGIDGYQVITVGGGTTKYQAHLKGGGWLDEIRKSDETPNGYAGIKGQRIDAITMWSQYGDFKYRVRTKEAGWLPWITGKYGHKNNEFAGNIGQEIIAIQVEVV